MKIVFFGNATAKNAAIRARLLKFAAMVEAEGHACVVCLPSSIGLWERLWPDKPFFSKLVYLLLVLLARAAQLRHVLTADVVFLRGPVFPYGPTFFEYGIHRLCPRMVFDIDDAVWERPAYVDSVFLKFQDFDWVWKMCRLCRHAVVGNQYLRATIEPRIPTTVIPTCVDMQERAQKEYLSRGPAGPVLLGWTGLSDNLGYLNEIAPALKRLAARHHIALHIASDKDFRMEGVRVDNERWQLQRQAEYLQIPDIGIMPLAHTPRAEGKCGFKALEFMAVGTPVVVSPVGVNTEIVQDGITGFLADTPDEWFEKLDRLCANPKLRERMGRAAREFVAEHYAHEVHFPAWRQVLLNVHNPAL